jgi:hypothetical protein
MNCCLDQAISPGQFSFHAPSLPDASLEAETKMAPESLFSTGLECCLESWSEHPYLEAACNLWIFPFFWIFVWDYEGPGTS